MLRNVFAAYGLPEHLVSDNGPQFTSTEFQEFLQANGVKHIRTAPYHPASNGTVKRLIQTLKQAMKAGKQDGFTQQHQLENFLITYPEYLMQQQDSSRLPCFWEAPLQI